MKNQIWKFVCALLVLSLLAAIPASADLPEQPVPFSRMKYVPLNPENTAAQIDRLTERLERTKNPDTAAALEKQVEALSSRFDTMYTLSSIHYDMDNRDDYWYGEYMKNRAGYAVVDAALQNFYGTLDESEGASSETEEAEYIALFEQESRLLMEYGRILGSGVVLYRGREYSLASMEALDYDAYYAAMDLWLDQYSLPLAEIYAELIGVRRQLAEIRGYDSYYDMALADMGYICSSDMVKDLLEDIAREAVPVYEELIDAGMYYGPEVELDFESFAAELPKILNKMDKSFGNMWRFMLENELIYTGAGTFSTPGAYSTYLADYGEPFIFCSYLGDADSMSILLHEFGHAYSDTMGFIYETDTAEVFSQAMQLLAANHYGEIFPDEAYELRYDMAADVFSSYMACAETMFELRAYELENPTAEELNALYAECDEVFKYYSADIPYEIYSRIWVTIAQLYDTPAYMLAYSVSADAALQLWEISLEDEQRAVKLFMNLIRNAENMYLPENLNSLGMRSAFDPGRVQETAAFCRKVLVDEVLCSGRGITYSWRDLLRDIAA